MSSVRPNRPHVLALSCLFPNQAQPNFGIFVLNRLKAVRRLCDVAVIAPIPVYPVPGLGRGAWAPRERVPPEDTLDGMPVRHPSFVIVPRFFKWFDALSYWWVARKAAKRLQGAGPFPFDIIDVHWTYPDIVAGHYLAKKHGKKLVVTIRGHEALYPGEHTIRRWLLDRRLRAADAIVTLSDELRDLVIALGIPAERVRTILNGVDREAFHPRDQAQARARLSIAPGQKVIVSVGALNEGKGHQELVRRMPGLSKSHDVALYIIGGAGPGGDLRTSLQEMARDLGLTNVHLVGRVPHAQLADWYSAADLFCLATKGEGCPNVVLEALSCGTPVVATDVGAIRELVIEGQSGFVVPPDRLDDLGPTMDRALSWPWQRQQIADRMNDWSWSSVADKVMETYRFVLNGEATRAPSAEAGAQRGFEPAASEHRAGRS